MRHLGHRHQQHGAALGDLLRLQPAKKGAQGRHGAGERAAGKARAAAGGHEGTEALGIEAGKVGQARRVADVGLEPDQELAQIALVGLQGVGRATALVLQMQEPRADHSAQVLIERQCAVVAGVLDSFSLHGPVPHRAIGTIKGQGLTKS